jgi:DNA-directed RNA polymerase delta subunit
LLERFGRDRPMWTNEILDAITKGGVGISTGSALYRSLARDPAFVRIGERKSGRWGLAKWYPDRS